MTEKPTVGRVTCGPPKDHPETNAAMNLWGIGIPGCAMGELSAIDLACVMYAQDVAEGRHT